MRLLRILVIALAAIVVAGAIASASPPIWTAPDADPTPEVLQTPEPSESPEPAESPDQEPTEASSPEPTATETSPSGDDEAVDDDASAAPDFSACVGLHGLENAICRHEALLAVQPDNLGLQNALEHLKENLARHEEEGEETSEGAASCPGKSCEPHGNGNGKP